MKFFPNGIGETTGGSLVTADSAYISGDVWYVNSTTGVDGVGLGKSRLAPLLTFAQAVTNSSDGDIICLGAGFTASIASQQTISKRLTVLSAGTGAQRAKFTRTGNVKMFVCSGARIQFRDVFFEDSTTIASTSALIEVSGANSRFTDCYFECGGYDEGPAIDFVTGADGYRISGTTFISVASALTDLPAMGVRVSNALAGGELVGAVFSGGTYGWSNAYAFDATAAAQTDLRGESISLLLDADMGVHASSTGFMQVGTASGSARVVW